jgi:hypothetical protein
MAERFDQETHRDWNREPGIVVVPGSNLAKEMQKFEQFPSKWGPNPGNAYRYRPYPKMLYRAELWKGKAVCMAAPPDPLEYPNPSEFQRAEEAARRFTERCQQVVKDERELQMALENGFRESPGEAVEYLVGRQRDEARAAAERLHEDRNMTEAAKAEAVEATRETFAEEGRHLPEVPEKRRRGRPRKNATA